MTHQEDIAAFHSVCSEVHYRAEALVRDHPGLDYAEALHRVLDADPDLKAHYAAGVRHG